MVALLGDELDLADEQNAHQNLDHVANVLLGEADRAQASLDRSKPLLVLGAARTALQEAGVRAQEPVLPRRAEQIIAELLFAAKTGEQQVEHVEGGLELVLVDNARFFEQVLFEFGAHHCAVLLEVDLQVLAEAARVVVDARLGVTERLQDVIDLLYLAIEANLERLGAREQVLHQVFAGLGLARAGLAADQNALTLLRANHLAEALLGRGVDVRRQRGTYVLAGLVVGRDALAVDGERLQRIERDQDVADVCVDLILREANLELLEH